MVWIFWKWVFEGKYDVDYNIKAVSEFVFNLYEITVTCTK